MITMITTLGLLLGVGIGTLIMFRVQQVLFFRMQLLSLISDAVDADLEANNYKWRWRYDTFDEVSYNKMVYQFWKRLKAENFYSDTSFLYHTKKIK